MSYTAMVREARQLLAAGESLDAVVQLLKDRGLTKMESMILLEDQLDIEHRDAKLAVHHSTAWRDSREAAETLEKDLLDSEE